jgi:hypothetical protein
LFPCVVEDGYYTIEDTCVVASGKIEQTQFEGKTLAQHIAKIYESMHFFWTDYVGGTSEFGTQLFDPIFSNQVKNIHMVNSMITLEKKVDKLHRLQNVMQGTTRIPFEPHVNLSMTIHTKNDQKNEVKFSTFVANNSELFTNDERVRLYHECLAFCVEHNISGLKSECAEKLMANVIHKSFGVGFESAPYLYVVNFD